MTKSWPRGKAPSIPANGESNPARCIGHSFCAWGCLVGREPGHRPIRRPSSTDIITFLPALVCYMVVFFVESQPARLYLWLKMCNAPDSEPNITALSMSDGVTNLVRVPFHRPTPARNATRLCGSALASLNLSENRARRYASSWNRDLESPSIKKNAISPHGFIRILSNINLASPCLEYTTLIPLANSRPVYRCLFLLKSLPLWPLEA